MVGRQAVVAASLVVVLGAATAWSATHAGADWRGKTFGAADWGANASAFRGNNGSQYYFACPAGGTLSSVWGTDTYTDDSRVCTAAAHRGVLGLSAGGWVVIEIRPGESSYTGSERNGVTSANYGAWSGSYVISEGHSGGARSGDLMGGGGWAANAKAFRGQSGTYTYLCPTDGTPASVWGTTVYTDDSSVCTAAVHTGLITPAGGGEVTIRLLGPQTSFTGSTRNGITSSNYGNWDGSFSFVGAGPTPTPTPNPTPTPTPTPKPKPTPQVSPTGLWKIGKVSFNWKKIKGGYEEKILNARRLRSRCVVRAGDAIDRFYPLGGGLYRVVYRFWVPKRGSEKCSTRWGPSRVTVRLTITATRMTRSCDNKPNRACYLYRRPGT